jgi:multidrug efflux system outer membrane protein
MNKLTRSGILLLALLSLSGCTVVGPDYVRPTVDSPEAWRIDYVEAAGVANTRWWEQFGDPALNQLIDTALQENKDLRIASARVEEFAARLEIARSGFYPQIGYNGQASRNQASRENFGGVPAGSGRSYNDYSAILNAGWEIDVWGRIRRATEASRAELLAQDENRRTVILSLVSAVANSYITLRQLDRQLEVSRDTLATRAEALRLFEIKFKGGVISELELAQVKVEYEQAAAAIPPIERQIAITENALSVLLGHNPASIPRGKSIDVLSLPLIPAGTPSSLLANRPDLRAAEQNLVAANARIGVARARYFPTISLTGLFGYVSEELDNLLQNSANVWSLGGNALGPIFTGGIPAIGTNRIP